jgi:hypothetical protein
MAAAEADARLITGKRSWAPAGLWLISLLCFLYIAFLYTVASNPQLRSYGFGTIGDIQLMSTYFFVFLFFAALAVEHYAPEAPASSRAAPPGPRTGGTAQPAARADLARVSLRDAHARPGAPPPTSMPRIRPDELEGGWLRWKFPSERTGGIYIDTDVVVDDVAGSAQDEVARGLHILRVRDEVARVCAQCDLIDHCHAKVRTLITRREMLANHECVAGLRAIAQVKIAQRNAAAAAAAQPVPPAAEAPGPAPAPGAPPASEVPAPAAVEPAPEKAE